MKEDLLEDLLVGIVLFSSALIHGLVGFAFATTALPLLALVKSVKFSVPLLSLLSFVVNLATLLLMKEKELTNFPLRFFGAIFFGVIIGVYGFKIASESTLRTLLFIAILSYFIWEVGHHFTGKEDPYIQHINPEVFKSVKALGVAFIVGFLGGILYTPGPPIVIYFSILRLKKDIFKATLQLIFMITALFTIINHTFQGNITKETLSSFFINLPIVLLGLYLGQRLYVRLSNKAFYYLVNLFLLISAVLLLLKNN
ncbi:MAG: sulfite exporter TauE/SafE family protein [Thermodesulfobacteriaceae bacterium]|jgi:uncharacterized membrane protein YfcA